MTYLAVIVVCLAFVAWREHQHTQERVTLLNRIQAPSVAVAQSLPDSEPVTHVGWDNDGEYWDAVRPNGGNGKGEQVGGSR